MCVSVYVRSVGGKCEYACVCVCLCMCACVGVQGVSEYVCVHVHTCVCLCVWGVERGRMQPLLSTDTCRILVMCYTGMLGSEVAGPCTVSTGLQHSFTMAQNDGLNELVSASLSAQLEVPHTREGGPGARSSERWGGQLQVPLKGDTRA